MKKQKYVLFATLLVFLFISSTVFARTIKIGVLQPLSGPYSDPGNQNKNGFLLKMKEAGV